MTSQNPDSLRHAFATFLGLPPDLNDQPVCGAALTPAYDHWPHDVPRDNCPACTQVVREWQRQKQREAN